MSIHKIIFCIIFISYADEGLNSSPYAQFYKNQELGAIDSFLINAADQKELGGIAKSGDTDVRVLMRLKENEKKALSKSLPISLEQLKDIDTMALTLSREKAGRFAKFDEEGKIMHLNNLMPYLLNEDSELAQSISVKDSEESREDRLINAALTNQHLLEENLSKYIKEISGMSMDSYSGQGVWISDTSKLDTVLKEVMPKEKDVQKMKEVIKNKNLNVNQTPLFANTVQSILQINPDVDVDTLLDFLAENVDTLLTDNISRERLYHDLLSQAEISSSENIKYTFATALILEVIKTDREEDQYLRSIFNQINNPHPDDLEFLRFFVDCYASVYKPQDNVLLSALKIIASSHNVEEVALSDAIKDFIKNKDRFNYEEMMGLAKNFKILLEVDGITEDLLLNDIEDSIDLFKEYEGKISAYTNMIPVLRSLEGKQDIIDSITFNIQEIVQKAVEDTQDHRCIQLFDVITSGKYNYAESSQYIKEINLINDLLSDEMLKGFNYLISFYDNKQVDESHAAPQANGWFQRFDMSSIRSIFSRRAPVAEEFVGAEVEADQGEAPAGVGDLDDVPDKSQTKGRLQEWSRWLFGDRLSRESSDQVADASVGEGVDKDDSKSDSKAQAKKSNFRLPIKKIGGIMGGALGTYLAYEAYPNDITSTTPGTLHNKTKPEASGFPLDSSSFGQQRAQGINANGISQPLTPQEVIEESARALEVLQRRGLVDFSTETKTADFTPALTPEKILEVLKRVVPEEGIDTTPIKGNSTNGTKTAGNIYGLIPSGLSPEEQEAATKKLNDPVIQAVIDQEAARAASLQSFTPADKKYELTPYGFTPAEHRAIAKRQKEEYTDKDVELQRVEAITAEAEDRTEKAMETAEDRAAKDKAIVEKSIAASARLQQLEH